MSQSLDCKEPIRLLEELSQQHSVAAVDGTKLPASSSSSSSSSSTAAASCEHWMLQFPSQCVLAIEAVLWERSVHNAVEKDDRVDLKSYW